VLSGENYAMLRVDERADRWVIVRPDGSETRLAPMPKRVAEGVLAELSFAATRVHAHRDSVPRVLDSATPIQPGFFD
jgi:hypothetical protein